MIGWRHSTRLPRDHYVRVDSNDYSVHPVAVGRRVQVVADLDEVVVTCDSTEVARHPRCWAEHQSLTDPDHARAAAQMRQARYLSARLAPVPGPEMGVEQRDLSYYDEAFGVNAVEEEIA